MTGRENAEKRRQEKEARKAREEQELQECALKLLLEQVIPTGHAGSSMTIRKSNDRLTDPHGSRCLTGIHGLRGDSEV